MAAPTLRPGDAWRIEIAGNPMFSSIKGLPAAMRPVCATGAALLRLALGWSPLLALRGGELSKIPCAVPLSLVIQASFFILEWLLQRFVQVMLGM